MTSWNSSACPGGRLRFPKCMWIVLDESLKNQDYCNKLQEEDNRANATTELDARFRAIEADIENLRVSLQVGDKRKERIEGLLADLRAGLEVTDFRFDDVFPGAMRELSGTHWTPVEVALRASSLLAAGSKTR